MFPMKDLFATRPLSSLFSNSPFQVAVSLFDMECWAGYVSVEMDCQTWKHSIVSPDIALVSVSRDTIHL